MGVQGSRVPVNGSTAPVVSRAIAVVHALQLLDIPSRELGVACRCYARVLRGHRVLVVVDREGLEAVVHNRGEVVPLATGVHPPSRVAVLHVLPRSSSGLALCWET